MNIGLLDLAREMKARITGFEEYETHYKNKTFIIDIERTPPFYFTSIYFNWTTVKNKDVLFVSGIDFNAKIEPIVYHHFYVFSFPPKIYKYPKIQIYFSPR
jgi:hypothetical protein